jgi:hypothetical protein
MHDIDRVQLEAEEFEAGLGESGQGESELPMPQTQELELASRLLQVSGGHELEQFLGDVFHAAGSAAGRFARSDTGQALRAILTDAVGRALPLVRGTTGGAIGPPSGGVPPGDLAQQAGSLLGLELEGLSPPDQEFETARQLVRLAGSAYRHAAWAPRNVRPRAAARSAAAWAARRHTPGLWPRIGRTEPRRDPAAWQGDSYRYSSGLGYPSIQGYPSGYGDSVGYRYPSGAYAQAMPGYWRRQRSWWYGAPPDAAAADEPSGYGSNGYDEPAVSGPPVVGGPPILIEPVVAEPPAAAPLTAADSPGTAAAEPASVGELGGDIAAASRWPFSASTGYPGARSGRWERHGQVLIVYGA